MPDTGERPRKRQRASQACHRCRSKKFRCDAQGPPCGACQTAHVDCLYDDATVVRRRGLKSGYVKILECLWGSAFQSIPGSEDAASSLLTRLHPSAEPANQESSTLERWRASPLPAAIHALLDGEPSGAAVSVGLERGDDPTLPLTESTWCLQQPPLADEETEMPPAVHESLGTAAARPPYPPPDLSSTVADLPALPPDWQTLVQVYLCTEHCWLPLVGKSALYRWAYSYQEHASIEISGLDVTSRGNYAGLWAALILAELHLNGAASIRITQMEQAGRLFLKTAESMEPGFAYSVAFLLWALIYIGRQSLVLARMMLAQAVVLADLSAEDLDTSGSGQQALAQNGCLVVDTILAFATGTQQKPTTEYPLSMDLGDIGEWDPFVNALEPQETPMHAFANAQAPPSRTGSTYLQLKKLLTIFNKASQGHANAEASASELEEWRASLPNHLKDLVVNQPLHQKSTVPSQLNLRLWYATISHIVTNLQDRFSVSIDLGEAQSAHNQQIKETLSTMVRSYGHNMLPSAASVLIQRLSARLSLQSPAVTRPSPQEQLSIDFAKQWGWLIKPSDRATTNTTGDPIPTQNVANREESDTTRSIIPASSSLMTNPGQNTGTVHQSNPDGLSSTQFQAGPNTEPQTQPQKSDASQAPATHTTGLVIDPALTISRGVDPTNPPQLDDPLSHDLLDYLTMFENDNSNERDFMEPLGFFEHQQP